MSNDRTPARSARDELFAHLDPIPVPAAIRDMLLNRYRAEVLREAAELADAHARSITTSAEASPLARRIVRGVGAMLRRHADAADSAQPTRCSACRHKPHRGPCTDTVLNVIEMRQYRCPCTTPDSAEGGADRG